jgi:hypothetical protein
LERALRAALRPEFQTSVNGATDSDTNSFVAQDASYTTSLRPGLQSSLLAGWRRASDPVRHGTSFGAAGRLTAALGQNAVLQAGLGVRRLAPEGGPGTTPLTAGLGLRVHPARYLAASIGYSRSPFDETALLIGRGLWLDAVDVGVDLSPTPRWSVSAGGGGAWLSDGNRRYSAVGAVLGRVLPGFQLGPYARVMGYRKTPHTGYFAPDRFTVFEGRAIYDWRHGRWGVRADGGVGSQEVSQGAGRQLAWHGGIALTRGWGANNEVALEALLTNSAATKSTSGTPTEGFRYRTLALRLQQGL